MGDEPVGETVRRHRLAAGLTQDELATRAGVSVRALRDLEHGRLRQPRAGTVRRLVDILAVTPTQREMLLAGLTSAGADNGPWVAVLGPLDVRRAGRTVEIPSKHARALLGLLALHHGQVVALGEIIDVLWGEDPPRTARNLVHIAASELRTLLGTGAPGVSSIGGGYALRVPDQRLDLARFDDLAARAHVAHAAGRAAEAADLFARALEWWRGPVLADADDRLRQHPAAVAARQRRIAATLAFADLVVGGGDIPGGDIERVLPALRALSHEDPLHEAVHGRLMLALTAAGERAAALTAFAELRARLGDELGIDPGPELQAIHLRVLRGDAPSTEAAMPTPAQLPAPPSHFTGRRAELKALDAMLPGNEPGAPTICLITGTPGVGKTALAVHWAHGVTQRFPDGQLYVNLRGFGPDLRAMSPAEAVRGFLDAAGVPAERVPTGLDAQTALYRSVMSGRRVLIVLDNARDADQVRPLLPGTPTAVVVVTSRNQLSPLVAIEGARPITLQVPSPGDARDLIARRLGVERVGREPGAVDQIIAACARLPLALVIAAARAQQTSFPLSALAAALESTGQRLNRLDAGDAATQVRAAFSWSYAGLTPPAARLLRLLAVHPPPDVGTGAAASLIGRPLAETQALLTELTRANLLEEINPGRFTYHDLLRAYATELSQVHDPADQRRAAAARLLDHYVHSALACDRLLDQHRPTVVPPPPAPGVAAYEPDDQRRALAWFDAERPALLAAVDLAAALELHGHTWRLAWALETYLDRLGHWSDLAAILTTAEAAARRQGDRTAQAHAHRGLARAYVRMERHGDAHTHLRHAVARYREIGDREGEAGAYRNLAYVCEQERRYAAALDYNRQALDLYLALGDRRGEAKTLNAVGWTHALLGEPEQALPYCQRALALNERWSDRYAQAVTWDSLGYVHLRLGDNRRAIAAYGRALALYGECGDRLYTANALNYLGDAHRAAGQVAEARAAWDRALSIMDELDRPEAGDVRAKLGRLVREG